MHPVQDWNHNLKTYFISHGAHIELTGNKAPQAVVKTGHKIPHPFEAINLGLKLLRCIFMCSKNNYTVPITSTVNLTTNWTKNNRGANFFGPPVALSTARATIIYGWRGWLTLGNK